MSDRPEVCSVPLTGIQLVEASAGTGKTHVIVGLYLRALVVLGLPVESVLLLSYTVAATAELRRRAQRRLLQAAAASAGTADADAELAAILDEARRARGEDAATLATRLTLAARALDRARIQTIHAWARTVAADEALALGLPLTARFVEDETAIARQALADAWRAALEDPERAPALIALGDPATWWAEAAEALLAPGEAMLPQSESVTARLVAEARQRLLRRRDLAGCYGLDEVLARLAARLDDPAGGDLAARLAARHPVVLIDEFQDADARQYAIFRALHAAGGQALLLVGDPKQAIYGFRGGDVETYLGARAEATPHRLRRNWRARPALIAGLNALYAAAGPRAFSAGREAGGIRHEPLIPAGHIDDAALVARQPTLLPAALCFAHLPGAPRMLGDRAAAEALIARHAAQLVACWQAAAATGDLATADGPPRVAVLAENHAQLERLATALLALGVPVRRRAPRQQARTIEADWLALWLAALVEPTPPRCRALAATPLIEPALVETALIRAELEGDAIRLRRCGLPAALLARLHAAPAGLADDAAQRLLQLAEALVLATAPDDPQDLLDALAAGAGSLPPEPERAEAGPAVSLLTVHAAKGLEFDLVLLPFAGARSRGAAAGTTPREWQRQREERLRTLYVALTRARLGLVVGLDLLGSRNELPALYHLLGADEVDGAGSPAQAARAAVQALADGRAIATLVWPALDTAPPPRPAAPAVPADPIPARRPPAAAPALASYSSLLRRDELTPMPDSTDAMAAPCTASDLEAPAELAGAGFGSAVHAVLEHADFAAWAGTGPLPAAESARLADILARLPSTDPAEARRAAVEAQVRAALNTPLPEGLRLCALPATDRRAELPFTLRLKDPRRGAAELARLAHRLRPVGIAGADLMPGDAPVGWLTGSIDLVYRHAGRWYVIDWKTNRLRPEHLGGPDGLARAVAESGYELQMLLYAVALDRWLAARLPGYRREAHFGGLRWMYLRALDADGAGIHAPEVPGALLDAAAALIGPG
jgi:exodeoxyribonuclease V beta subunit